MISVIGLGFVGLTTGLGFAKKGYHTFGFDINEQRMGQLKNGMIPFHEPHLKEILEETQEKNFFLDVDFEKAIKRSKYIFLCVGTPSDEKGSADLTFIFRAIDQILAVPFNNRKIIIIKSTVPPSTLSEKIQPYILKKADELDRLVGLASNPEFLREGYCWEDFIHPDRVVIGAEDLPTQVMMKELYAPFEAPMHIVTYNTAEFIKYLSNTLLSTLISYANEMSMIADKIGNIQVSDAFKILHGDKRWTGSPAGMSAYVYPGCGYGGYCLPKDTSALYNIAKEKGVDAKILKANLDVNAEVKDFIVDKISSQVQRSESLGILGLSFKPESDDVRLSPTQEVIKKLQEFGFADIIAYDPLANNMFKEEYPDMIIDYAPNLESLLEKTKNVVVLTAWKEFKDKQALVQTKNVFDFRYMFV